MSRRERQPTGNRGGSAPFFLTLLCAFAMAAALLPVRGEIVYLNDGSVVKGDIVRESKDDITVRSEGGERTIRHEAIKRILYGNMDMEKVYILTAERAIVTGFLVDQDDDKVILRERKDSPLETTLSKRGIRDISREEIHPIDLELFAKLSGFIPLDSGGAALKPSALYTGGIGFNSMIVKDLRILIEAGYTRAESADHEDQYLRIIPVTLGAAWTFGWHRLGIVPRAGLGIGMLEYATGEGETLKSTALMATAGAGLVYDAARHSFFIGLWAEYIFLFDGSDYLQGALAGVSVGYRL